MVGFNKQRKKISTKKLGIIFVLLLIGVVGSYFMFFAKAAPGVCDANGLCTVQAYWNGTPGSQDFFLAGNGNETLGAPWEDRGVIFKAYNHPIEGTTVVRRFYNASVNQHLWTLDDNEASAAIAFGAQEENQAFYAAKTQIKDTVPVFRLSNSSIHSYYYTTDPGYRDQLLQSGFGWTDGNPVFYVYMPGYTPKPANIPCEEQVLSEGDSGECVKVLQSKLNLLNAQLPVDGEFTSAVKGKLLTLQAFWKFSRQDGSADSTTWADIEKVKDLAVEKEAYTPPPKPKAEEPANPQVPVPTIDAKPKQTNKQTTKTSTTAPPPPATPNTPPKKPSAQTPTPALTNEQTKAIQDIKKEPARKTEIINSLPEEQRQTTEKLYNFFTAVEASQSAPKPTAEQKKAMEDIKKEPAKATEIINRLPAEQQQLVERTYQFAETVEQNTRLEKNDNPTSADQKRLQQITAYNNATPQQQEAFSKWVKALDALEKIETAKVEKNQALFKYEILNEDNIAIYPINVKARPTNAQYDDINCLVFVTYSQGKPIIDMEKYPWRCSKDSDGTILKLEKFKKEDIKWIIDAVNNKVNNALKEAFNLKARQLLR